MVSHKQNVKNWPHYNKTTLYLETISMVSWPPYFIARNLYLQSCWLYWYDAMVLTVQLYYNWYFMHCRDIAWAPGISSQLATWLFIQKCVQFNIKGNIKSVHQLPSEKKIHRWLVDSRTKGLSCRKHFHFMSSSCSAWDIRNLCSVYIRMELWYLPNDLPQYTSHHIINHTAWPCPSCISL